MTSTMAIEIKNVSFAYSGVSEFSLKEVSLAVQKGECVVITGPSGCGKSTLTRVINGLIPHVYKGELEGTTFVSGRDVAMWDSSDLGTMVGSVFQNPRSQFVNIDVTSEIAFGCENLGMPREEIIERVHKCARVLGIEHLLGQRVESLSGGQKQLVIIASALAMNPDIFVLDEPTASLDVNAMRCLAHAVRVLKEQGKTVIVSEHRLWWLNGIADRVIRMKNGSIAGDWSAYEYQNIPYEERVNAGERAWSIDEIVLIKPDAARYPLVQLSNQQAKAQNTNEEENTKAQSGSVSFLLDDSSPNCFKEANANSGKNDNLRHTDCLKEKNIFSISNLKASYKRKNLVLDGINLEVESGTVVGILGKNGAGKTTLLRCLSGLMCEKSGQIVLDDVPLSYRKRLGKIHLVMQEPGYQLFADSVLTETVQALESSGSAQALDSVEIAEEILTKFNLMNLKDRHPLSLSGGERQRLSIIASVLQGASAIVLDEPTSGLDRESMIKITEAIRDYARKNHAVCIVTHDFEFLCKVCDEVAEIENGKISKHYRLDSSGFKKAKRAFGF